MTYGRWLDDAASALAAAADAARHTKATGHNDAAAVAAARHRTYHGLGRLTHLITGVVAPRTTPGQADLLVNTHQRLKHTDPAVLLATALRTAAGPIPGSAARAVSPFGHCLAEAADALATAGDILASHLNPGARPRTPEGTALQHGAGRTGGLADIALLAHAALQADRHLPAWLGRTDPTLPTVYQAVIDTTRWWTRGPYPAVLRAIANRASGILRTLDIAPPSSRTGDPRHTGTRKLVAGRPRAPRPSLRVGDQLAHLRRPVQRLDRVAGHGEGRRRQPQHRHRHTATHPDPIRKTRIIAAVLDSLGYDTTLLERRLDDTSRTTAADHHVALIGVDNLPTRRLISTVGWRLAVDAGLGTRPADFDAILLRRFPAARPSHETPGWADALRIGPGLPDVPAFNDLKRRDPCGVVELAGTAVGAAFVGVTAACLAIAEGTRELLGGDGHDVINLHLHSTDLCAAPATSPADVIPAQLSLDG